MRYLFALLVLLVGAPVGAHDLWLDKVAGGYSLFQGHRHSAHAGAEIVPYEPAAVKSATCLDPTGSQKSLSGGKTHPVKFSGDCTVLLVSFSTGYWTKTAWETVNKPRTGVAGVLKSWLSEESVKRIDRWVPASGQPMGAALEITPLTDPLKLAIDQKLTVLVTENGKPRPGVAVAYLGDTRGATGEDGRIAIRIRQGGVQLIAASIEQPLASDKAETVIRATALQFELPR